MSAVVNELTLGRTLPRTLPQRSGASNRRVFRGAAHAVAAGARVAGRGVAAVLTERRPSSSTLPSYDYMALPGWGAKRS